MATRKKAGGSLSEKQLLVLLAERYSPPAFAFFPQVRNGAGFNASRTVDALAMSLWPSRGLELHGFECKSRREDWIRELENPRKADETACFCDRWWVVVGASDIVRAGELPPTWGLMEARGRRLFVKAEAPKLDAKPLDRDMLAVILRRAAEARPVEPAAISARVDRAYDEGFAEGVKKSERAVAREKDEAQQLRETIARFQAASGLRINQWDAGRIGQAVKFTLEGGLDRSRRELEQMRDRAQAIAESIAAQLQEAPRATGTGGA